MITVRSASQLVRHVAAFALTICVPLGAHASSPRGIPPVLRYRQVLRVGPQQAPVYRTAVTQHLLQVSVTDRSGRPVTDLAGEDFALREDGEVRPIQTFLAPFESPLEVALVSDRSGSMELGYDKAEEAAHAFLDGLGPNDCVRFSAFSYKPLATDWMRPDDPVLRQAIDHGWIGGSTALYDAILDSQVALAGRALDRGLSGRGEIPRESALLDLFQFERFYRELLDPERNRGEGGCVPGTGGSPPRQAILVITDGVDSASSASSKADVLRAAAFSRVPIFAASVRPPRPSSADEMPPYSRSRTGLPTTEHVSGYLIAGLGDIAESSGGALVTTSTMTKAHRWLLQRLHSLYVIGFERGSRVPNRQTGGGRVLVPGSLELEIPGRDDLRVSFQRAIYDEATARTAAATEAALAGFSLLREGATDAAAATFGHALSLDEGLAAAHFGLGRVLVRQDDPRRALPHLEAARHLAPWASVVHASLARVQTALGLVEDAGKSNVRAVEAAGGLVAATMSLPDTVAVPPDLRAMRPRVYLLVPIGADVTTYETSRGLLAAIGRSVLWSANLGLAGTPDRATLALRLRFRLDRRRRPTTDAVLYARGGGNYDPITLDLGSRDDAAPSPTVSILAPGPYNQPDEELPLGAQAALPAPRAHHRGPGHAGARVRQPGAGVAADQSRRFSKA